jgi:hypothetical protein
MLSRDEKGTLNLDFSNLKMLLGDMFVKCRNEYEIAWLKGRLSDCLECAAEEKLKEVEEK